MVIVEKANFQRLNNGIPVSKWGTEMLLFWRIGAVAAVWVFNKFVMQLKKPYSVIHFRSIVLPVPFGNAFHPYERHGLAGCCTGLCPQALVVAAKYFFRFKKKQI